MQDTFFHSVTLKQSHVTVFFHRSWPEKITAYLEAGADRGVVSVHDARVEDGHLALSKGGDAVT